MTGEARPDRDTREGRGRFFAVDRRTWHSVCGLGMNQAVAYLVVARGTGCDNATTKWSGKAVEKFTGISRSRARAALISLMAAGAILDAGRDKLGRPRYKLAPAHEIPGCEGYPPAALTAEQAAVHAKLGDQWTHVEAGSNTRLHEKWGTWSPGSVADELVRLGRAERLPGRHYRAIRYHAEAAALPDWIWLPNDLVTGAADETPPVELVRQTGNVYVLRMLVNLYAGHLLDENGGIHFWQLREQYERRKVGESGPYVVWGFGPKKPLAATWGAPFSVPHWPGSNASKDAIDLASKDLWATFERLKSLGLCEFVAHLVEACAETAEIIHPVALPGTGLPIEGKLREAATAAGKSLITEGQLAWAQGQGIVVLAPILRHIENPDMVGVCRLRYLPQTTRTAEFLAREGEWREAIERLRAIAQGTVAPSRSFKVGSR